MTVYWPAARVAGGVGTAFVLPKAGVPSTTVCWLLASSIPPAIVHSLGWALVVRVSTTLTAPLAA